MEQKGPKRSAPRARGFSFSELWSILRRLKPGIRFTIDQVRRLAHVVAKRVRQLAEAGERMTAEQVMREMELIQSEDDGFYRSGDRGSA